MLNETRNCVCFTVQIVNSPRSNSTGAYIGRYVGDIGVLMLGKLTEYSRGKRAYFIAIILNNLRPHSFGRPSTSGKLVPYSVRLYMPSHPDG